MSKSREYWIDIKPRPIGYVYDVYEFKPESPTVHLIEAAPVLQMLESMAEVLKWYAREHESWMIKSVERNIAYEQLKDYTAFKAGLGRP